MEEKKGGKTEVFPFLAALLSICILIFIGANNDWFVSTSALPGQAGRNNLTQWQFVPLKILEAFICRKSGLLPSKTMLYT